MHTATSGFLHGFQYSNWGHQAHVAITLALEGFFKRILLAFLQPHTHVIGIS